MKAILGILIILLILKVTNPDMQAHKSAITKKCKELNPVTGAIGGCNLYSTLQIKYVDYYLISYTLSGQEVVSVGLLTVPFVIKDLDF
jgi:hypothetical protein